LIINALLVALFLAFSGCGVNPSSDGVDQGYDRISVANGSGERYDFYIPPEYYGYFIVDNLSGNARISAPYGVYMTVEDLSAAPANGYTSSDELITGYYYIIRPDSTYYAKLYIESIIYMDTLVDIYFQWYLQTKENVRAF